MDYPNRKIRHKDFINRFFPAGTGDIHITLINELHVNGAIIVGTPQQVALASVVKGLNMFRNKDIHIPIIGLVENMAEQRNKLRFLS